MEKREFGFGNDKKIDYRHYAFKNHMDLENYFMTQGPLYASASVAYYEFPDGRPMEKKKLLGADLVFEFDAECKEPVICEKCLDEVKQETTRLIEDFLIPDFGFGKDEIRTCFSGSRGYHIYVYNDAVRQLDGASRRQIVDYIQARGINQKAVLQNASLESGGWKGRLARIAYDFVEKTEVKDFRKAGLVKVAASKTPERKEEILAAISSGKYATITKKTWDDILNEKIVHLSSNVDQLVTLDVHKLMRLPSTIHGGAGLLCMDVKSLDAFHPFRDAVVFGDQPLKVKVIKDVPAFIMKEQTFGPFRAEEVKELPEFAAMHLLCRELARAAQ